MDLDRSMEYLCECVWSNSYLSASPAGQRSTGREGRVGILDGPSSSEVLRNGTLEMCGGGGSPWRFIGHSLVGVGDLTS